MSGPLIFNVRDELALLLRLARIHDDRDDATAISANDLRKGRAILVELSADNALHVDLAHSLTRLKHLLEKQPAGQMPLAVRLHVDRGRLRRWEVIQEKTALTAAMDEALARGDLSWTAIMAQWVRIAATGIIEPIPASRPTDGLEYQRVGDGLAVMNLVARQRPQRLVEWMRDWMETGAVHVRLGEFIFVGTCDVASQRVVDQLRAFAASVGAVYQQVIHHVEGRMPDIDPAGKADALLLEAWYPHVAFRSAAPRPTLVEIDPHGRNQESPAVRRQRRKECIEHFYGAFHPQWTTLTPKHFPIPVHILPRAVNGFPGNRRLIAVTRITPATPGGNDWRVYFYDPFVHAPVSWGRVTVSTSQYGEALGEASLAFHEFATVVTGFPTGDGSTPPSLDAEEQKKINQAAAFRVY